MKASEMTNEHLAKEFDGIVASGLFRSTNDLFREAAARLSQYDGIKIRMRQVFKPQFEMRDAIIAELKRRLKDAEEALTDALEHVEIRKNNEYDDADVIASCDKTISRCKSVLAAIRAEGGVNLKSLKIEVK